MKYFLYPLPTRKMGAALLSALITVAIVASLSASAFWQQWRGIEIEASERTRVQLMWLLLGTNDWARLILRLDVQASHIDHLAEPWAIGLQESKISSFLAANTDNVANVDIEQAIDAFLSGRIEDEQGKINLRNLTLDEQTAKSTATSIQRLFALLQLPASDANQLISAWITATKASATSAKTRSIDPTTLDPQTLNNAQTASGTPSSTTGALKQPNQGLQTSTTGQDSLLLPARLQQLALFGISNETIKKIQPFVTILPNQTTINVNTASAQVLHASIASLDFSRAQQLVYTRQKKYFTSIDEFSRNIPNSPQTISATHSVSSQYFQIRSSVRLGEQKVEQLTLVQRRGFNVHTLWRVPFS